MTYSYTIDSNEGIVAVVLDGVLQPRTIVELGATLRQDSGFDRSFHMLIDGSGLTELREIDSAHVKLLAHQRGDMHESGSRRAFVLSEDMLFGMTRMFAALGAREDGEMAVFRERQAAIDWLRSTPD